MVHPEALRSKKKAPDIAHKPPDASRRTSTSDRSSSGAGPPGSSAAPSQHTSGLPEKSNKGKSTHTKSSTTTTTSKTPLLTTSSPKNTPNNSRPNSPFSPTNSRPSSPTNSTASQQNQNSKSQTTPEFKYILQNISEQYATQKKFYTLLTTHLNVKNIKQLIINYNKSGLLITSTPLPDNIATHIKVLTNSQTFTISPPKKRSPLQPSNSHKKPPMFSVVIKDVDMDITHDDILDYAEENSLVINKSWRIISKKTNNPTKLIRVLSDETTTIDFLLARGIILYGKKHFVEASHPPAPAHLQCAKCFSLGHSLPECPNKPKCPTCPLNNHPPGKCPATAAPVCPRGDGAHPAWSRSCNLFKTPVTEETPVQPIKILNPTSDFAEQNSDISDPEPETQASISKPIVAFVTKVIFDLFPLRREESTKIIEKASRQIFNLLTKISISGNFFLLTFN